MNLRDTLAQKPLFYSTIDTNRMPNAYEKFKQFSKLPPVVHIVGTNGKGSTGRFLALMLRQTGKRVGHYTSPHIVDFNERFWIDGKNATDEALELAHNHLQNILPKKILDELSYFEYATFLAAIIFEDCDIVIMEAGLGGEWDATNVFPKILSIITPIGYDHQDFLGHSMEEIASTKLRSITTTTLLSSGQDPRVVSIAQSIGKEREVFIGFASEILNHKTLQDIQEYAKKYAYPNFLQENIALSYSAARLLHVKPDIATLPPLDLRARFEWIRENVLLDCGHNPMAARALVESLEDKKYTFVYNAYEDKDVEGVLEIVYPKMEALHVIPMGDKLRPNAKERIIAFASQNGIEIKEFDYTLGADRAYVVFGSFGVVEAFLKGMHAK